MIRHLANRLEECDCFVDVGANLGYYSVLAGKILATRGGVVHAVEMDDENAERIRKNLRINDLNNVVVHQVALGNSHGSVEYYWCNSLRNTLEVSPEERDQYLKSRVPITTMDSFIQEE